MGICIKANKIINVMKSDIPIMKVITFANLYPQHYKSKAHWKQLPTHYISTHLKKNTKHIKGYNTSKHIFKYA